MNRTESARVSELMRKAGVNGVSLHNLQTYSREVAY